MNVSSLEGWDIAYKSSSKHEVGVINPDLLPSKSLIYKYYFALNPQVTQGTDVSFGGFIGGISPFGGVPIVSTAFDSIAFDLDFVVSSHMWNQLILASEENVSNDILSLPKHAVNVAYVFKVILDSNGSIESIVDISSENPVPLSQLPDRPNESDGKDAWFQFYENFQNIGEWSSYNRFQGKQNSIDQEYTLEHKSSGSQTNSKRIKVRNLSVGDYYIVSYEGVDNHLFRHHVDMTFDQFVFVLGGVNLSPPPFENTNKSRFAHYLWKEWADDDGNFHEGWRVSETWQMNANSYRLLNEDIDYDEESNPVSGIEKYVDWSIYNMSERNLKLKDSERIGYSRSYAEYLSSRSGSSMLTEDQANLIDTNNVTPDNVHPNNFIIERVSDNVVNYSGGGYGIIEQGGSLGVLFDVINTQYYGFFLSNYYRRSFPKNTRLVSAYSRIRHGGNGRVIAVLTKAGGQHVTAVQDPMFFMTVGENLYYHYLNDDFTKIMMAYRMSKSSDEVEYGGNNMIGSDSVVGSGTLMIPGRNVLISDNSDSTDTYINSGSLTSNPSIDPQSVSIAKYVTLNGSVSDVSDSYPNKPNLAVKVFNVSGILDSSVLCALKVKFSSESNSSAVLRLVGIGNQDRQLFNVSVPIGIEHIIDLGAWEDMKNIYIMSNVDCSMDYCRFIILGSDLDRSRHVVSNISSMASVTTSRGHILLYYSDTKGRLNVIYTDNETWKWNKFENILIRGDEISDIRGVPNMQDDIFFIFHFYKGSLLCVPMDSTIFMLSKSLEKRIEAIDTIRRSACYLVWGDAIKPESEKLTQKDSDGNYIYEDINDNIIFTESDEEVYQNSGRSVLSINSSESANTETKDLSKGNKFIYIGKKTSSSDLASSNPKSTNYCVYINKRGILRLFIEDQDQSGKSIIRNLNSLDFGLNWEDGWKSKKNNIQSSEEHVVRINYLSDGENSEEGENISVIYNDSQDVAYIMYFYSGCVLYKPIPEQIFNISDLDEQSQIINSIPIYAIAGNLQSIVSESNYAGLENLDRKNISFNYFQRNEDNLNKYYSDEYYNSQPISGYFTKGGYLRIFLVNKDNEVDGYFFDGEIWLPDKAVLI